MRELSCGETEQNPLAGARIRTLRFPVCSGRGGLAEAAGTRQSEQRRRKTEDAEDGWQWGRGHHGITSQSKTTAIDDTTMTAAGREPSGPDGDMRAVSVLEIMWNRQRPECRRRRY